MLKKKLDVSLIIEKEMLLVYNRFLEQRERCFTEWFFLYGFDANIP